MNLRLNRTLFQQTDADSGALTMLTSVVHRPNETGDHVGTVYRNDQPVGDFVLRVLDQETPLSVHIDLAGARLRDVSRARLSRSKDDCCDEEKADGRASAAYEVARGGYVVFHVSEGTGGYTVQLARASTEAGREPREGREPRPWSSAQLGEGDLFAVTLLRPGTYRLANQSGGEGKIALAYPERGRVAYRPPEPLRVAAADTGFEPAGIELRPLQGLVFEIRTESRITITLVEPEDRPQEPRPDMPERPSRLRYTLRRRRPVEDAGPG